MLQPFTQSQIEIFRQVTPGVTHHLHFNNAGASLPTDSTLKAISDYLQQEAIVGGYKMEEDCARELQTFYHAAAQLINSSPKEIAIVGSATIAWRTAFNGLDFQAGDVILTSEPEYGSNIIAFLQVAEQFEVTVKIIPNDEFGQVSIDALAEMIDSDTKLISLSHIPSNSGIVQPAEKVGEIARKHDILYLLDACQSAGQLPLDVEKLHCDFLTVTGRKYLRGPRGTGFLYIREKRWDEIDSICLDMLGATFDGPLKIQPRADARRFETYEANRALQMGLTKAIQYALELGMDNIWNRIQKLSDRFRTKLSAIPGIKVHDQGVIKSGIVTFSDEYHTSQQLKGQFEAANMRVSVTPKDAAIIYMHGRKLPELLRASIHYYNTDEEVDQFCEVLLNSRP